MNWVRQNRFLSSFLAILILGAAGLGFLLYTSLSRYQQVDADYKTQVTELHRLQDLHPFPDAISQKKYEDVRKNFAAAVATLQADLAGHEPHPANPPPSPIQFQDKLRQVVQAVTTLAQNAGVALPDGFYLGFEQYRGSPPEAAATALLDSQLDAIENIVDILIKTRVDKVISVKRAPLPQEGGAAAPAAPAGRPGAPGAPATPGVALVSKQTLEIAFSTLPSSFRESLNDITKDERLYIVRALVVKNQVDKGPSQEAAEVTGGTGQPPISAPAPTAPEPGGVPNPPLPEKGPPPLRYVVGQEHLDVVARIELAKVAPPTATR